MSANLKKKASNTHGVSLNHKTSFNFFGWKRKVGTFVSLDETDVEKSNLKNHVYVVGVRDPLTGVLELYPIPSKAYLVERDSNCNDFFSDPLYKDDKLITRLGVEYQNLRKSIDEMDEKFYGGGGVVSESRLRNVNFNIKEEAAKLSVYEHMGFPDLINILYAYFDDINRCTNGVRKSRWEPNVNHDWSPDPIGVIRREKFTWGFIERMRRIIQNSFLCKAPLPRPLRYSEDTIFWLINLLNFRADERADKLKKSSFKRFFYGSSIGMIGPINPSSTLLTVPDDEFDQITKIKNSFLYFFTHHNDELHGWNNFPLQKIAYFCTIRFDGVLLPRSAGNLTRLQEEVRRVNPERDVQYLERVLSAHLDAIELVFEKAEFELNLQRIKYGSKEYMIRIGGEECLVNPEYMFVLYKLHFLESFTVSFKKMSRRKA